MIIDVTISDIHFQTANLNQEADGELLSATQSDDPNSLLKMFANSIQLDKPVESFAQTFHSSEMTIKEIKIEIDTTCDKETIEAKLAELRKAIVCPINELTMQLTSASLAVSYDAEDPTELIALNAANAQSEIDKLCSNIESKCDNLPKPSGPPI